MINRLSNPINRNRSAAKISKVMSSNIYTTYNSLKFQSFSFQGILEEIAGAMAGPAPLPPLSRKCPKVTFFWVSQKNFALNLFEGMWSSNQLDLPCC